MKSYIISNGKPLAISFLCGILGISVIRWILTLCYIRICFDNTITFRSFVHNMFLTSSPPCNALFYILNELNNIYITLFSSFGITIISQFVLYSKKIIK